MEYRYEIRPFSAYSTYTTTAASENVSAIIDRLIRVAAKVTEHYAGDVVYDIQALQEAVQTRRPLDLVLLFRSGGVSTVKPEDGVVPRPGPLPRAIQAWRLTHNPENTETVLRRVTLCARREWQSDYVGDST